MVMLSQELIVFLAKYSQRELIFPSVLAGDSNSCLVCAVVLVQDVFI